MGRKARVVPRDPRQRRPRASRPHPRPGGRPRRGDARAPSSPGSTPAAAASTRPWRSSVRGRRAKTEQVDLPGHVQEGFVTAAVEVTSSDEHVSGTLKQKLRRGALSRARPAHGPDVPLRPRARGVGAGGRLGLERASTSTSGAASTGRASTPRSPCPRTPTRCAGSGSRRWPAAPCATRWPPGTSPRSPTSPTRAASATTSSTATTSTWTPPTARSGSTSRSRRRGPSSASSSTPGRPSRSAATRSGPCSRTSCSSCTTYAARSTSTKLFPYWPLIARVANRVGPWFPLGPLNINGRVKSIAMHPLEQRHPVRRRGERRRVEVDQRRQLVAHDVEVRGQPRDRRRRDGTQQRQRRLRRHR